jgi:hypothetical protein
MVGRRTQQTLAPVSHVQGDSAAGTHSNLHDLASLTRWWTAAINKNMTRSLCHLNAENSFLPRCDVASLGGQFLLLQRITIVTSVTVKQSMNFWSPMAKALQSFVMSGITQHEISEKLNLSQHHCENLKSRII